ncbi:MAG TPA: CAAX prenyl protease-related protein [Fimbriimonadaceae bacterium]|nr:CAAX prenyl protease-related protein [Fimbriimonadaceae bacterium]
MQKPRNTFPDWLPYVLPMALFLGLTYLEGKMPENYVWLYFGKIAAVVAALIWARPTWKDIKWEPKQMPLAVVLGLVLFAVWVGIEKYVVYPHLGDRSAYDPWQKIPDPALRSAFVAVRFFGLVLVVPFMEELFWRSFGLRYATQTDFQALPIGKFSMTGALIVCGLFALAHPEWIPALIFAAAMTVLVARTKSVFACFVAHAVTNLALGIYVVTQGAWTLW